MKRPNAALVFPDPQWGEEILRADPHIGLRISATRPTPPADVDDDQPERFVPDVAFAEWIRDTFIVGGAPLENETHQHLLDANICVLWTNVIHVRQQLDVLATAEMPQTMGGAWKRGRAEQQMRDWFEMEPTFLLTFYAPGCGVLDDRAFCALVEHELLHCAQAKDAFGVPRFSQMTGAPIFAMRGHDSEEFVDIVARYGTGAVTDGTRRLIAAASRRPSIADVSVARACGACLAA